MYVLKSAEVLARASLIEALDDFVHGRPFRRVFLYHVYDEGRHEFDAALPAVELATL